MSTNDTRRAKRVPTNAPTVIEVIAQPRLAMHPNLMNVYERVSPNDQRVGEKFPGVVRDVSTNGAFIAGEPLPLLSRVTFDFDIEGFGSVTVFGWTLWRRSADCTIPRAYGPSAVLPKGFGVLFEAVPIDARLALHNLSR